MGGEFELFVGEEFEFANVVPGSMVAEFLGDGFGETDLLPVCCACLFLLFLILFK